MSYGQDVLGRGPLHYFRMNDTVGTTLVDMQGNQNGDILGTATRSQASDPEIDDDINGAMRFISSSYASLLHNAVLNGISFLVIDLWFKLNSYAATSVPNQNPILNKWGSGSHEDDWFEIFVDNNTRLLWCTAANGLGQNDNIQSVSVINLATWYHLVYTFNDGLLKLYLNNVLEASKACTFSQFNQGLAEPPIGIGGHPTYPARPFDGWLDEIAIYDSPWPKTIAGSRGMGLVVPEDGSFCRMLGDLELGALGRRSVITNFMGSAQYEDTLTDNT